MYSLVAGKAIQFYSCFISYSTKDQEFADRLHADLQSKGVRVWFAPDDIKGGQKLHEQIPEAIRLYDKLLLVLSENSIKSNWVETEIYHAIQDETRENRRKLFPIGLAEFRKIASGPLSMLMPVRIWLVRFANITYPTSPIGKIMTATRRHLTDCLMTSIRRASPFDNYSIIKVQYSRK